MLFTIGFRSGARIEIEVRDPTALVLEIQKAVAESPAVPRHWFADPSIGLMFQVEEVEFMLPSKLIIASGSTPLETGKT